jgi:tetratricopeptide (TPR) repeat protein
MILSALREGKASLEEAERFPQGLNGIFLQWFQWYFPDVEEYDRRIRPALNLMAASPEPIPEEEITEITGWRKKQTEDFLRLMNVHLRVSGKRVIDFNHLFVREWLESSNAGEYRIYREDGIIEMTEFAAGLLEEDDPEITEYEALHILSIMKQAAGLRRSLRRAYNDAKNSEALMKRQEELGRECSKRNEYVTALRYLKQALEIAESRFEEEQTAENRKHLIICRNRIAQAEGILGHTEEASRLNEEALVFAEQNVEERGILEDRRRAAVAMMIIADGIPGTDRAAQLYEKARGLLEAASLEADPDDEDVFRNLAIVYNRLGIVSMRRGDAADAVSWYRKDLQITRKYAMKTGKREARRDLAVSYYKLAGVYHQCGFAEEGREYYDLAVKTMEYLVNDHPLPDEIRGLAVLLNAKGAYMSDQESSEEEVFRQLIETYKRSLTMSRRLTQEYGLTADHRNEAASLTNIGIIHYRMNDKQKAAEIWKEAYNIFVKYDSAEAERLNHMIQKCGVL